MQRPSRWIGGDLREDPAAGTGRLAWLVWGMAHIYFLIGFCNRMAMATDWLWSYLTYQHGAQLITGHDM